MSADVKTGYKLTEVGVIPEDWEVKPLYTICTAILDCHHSTPVWTKSGEFVIRNQNIRDGKLNFSVPSFTDEKHFLERTQRAIPTFGDLIITREAPMGLVCMIPEGLKCCLGQRMVLLRIDQHSTAHRFVLYALLGESVQRYISVVGGTGSTVSNLRIPVLRGLKIATPKKAEQEVIAEALSDADALIESLEQLITKKRQIKQGAMQELLTGKKRLPGFSGEWEVKKLGDVAEVIMGQSPSSTNYNTEEFGLPLIQGNADIVDRKTIKRVFTTEVTRKGKCGDILLSVRAPVGEVSHAVFDVCLGRGVCAIRTANHFIYHYLISQEPSWAKISKGSTFDSVNSADVKAFAIYLPVDSNEQIAIAEILEDMDVEIERLEVKLEKGRQLKQGMMYNLLTGKIRVV